MSKIYRALLRNPRDLIFEEISLPEVCNAHDIRGETRQTAISLGTEVAAYRGDPPLRPGPVYPRRLGYCNVGKIVELGSTVEDYVVGQRILTHVSHQSGFQCPADEILAVIPDSVSDDDAGLAYLAQLGMAALQKIRFRIGETVLIQGLGAVGLATVALAKALGARPFAIGRGEDRLRLAVQLGAEFAWEESHPQLLDGIDLATNGEGIDVGITTVNSWAAWRQMLALSRFQTRIAVLGFPGRTEGVPNFNPLESAEFHDKQLTFAAAGMMEDSFGVMVSPLLKQNMREIFRLLGSHVLVLAPIISHRLPWTEMASIYEQAMAGDKSIIGAVLDWEV